MDSIIEPTMDYDFSKLYLGPPSTLAGGSYFTRIMYNNNKPLYIQTPKSLTKQSFVKSGKKIYVDLMFDNNDTVFINWIENLETTCQQLIFTKSESWFDGKLEKDDIETAFTSPFKIFKSGKYYLLRVNVKPNLKIYNEHDIQLKIEDVKDDNNLISILEIQGIKFTSRNFQIEVELKQTMVVSPDPFLDECFIKKPIRKQNQLQINSTIIQDDLTSDNYEKQIDDFINESVNEMASNVSTIDLDSSFEQKLEEKKDSIIELNSLNKNVMNSSLNSILEEEVILLDVEELDKKVDEKEDTNVLKEFDVMMGLENSSDVITLKKPNQVYYEIYNKAREKAKEAKQTAILAYLEAKNIKKTYMLDDIVDSDSEDDIDLDDINSDISESQDSENDS